MPSWKFLRAKMTGIHLLEKIQMRVQETGIANHEGTKLLEEDKTQWTFRKRFPLFPHAVREP